MYQHATQAVTPGRVSILSGSLQSEECSVLWNLVKPTMPTWSGDFFTDPFGELNLIVMPPDADDDIGPMLIIYKRDGLYVVDTFRWDEYGTAGTCVTLDETAATIEWIVASNVSPYRPAASVH